MLLFNQQRQIVTKIRDTHRRQEIIDFVRVTRLNCRCHLLNAGDLAGLHYHVGLTHEHRHVIQLAATAAVAAKVVDAAAAAAAAE